MANSVLIRRLIAFSVSIFITLVQILAIQASSAQAVGSASCPFADPLYQQPPVLLRSTACLANAPDVIRDIWDEFDNNVLWMSPSLVNNFYRGHINQTVWAFSGAPCVSYAEVGLTWGGQVGRDWVPGYFLYTGYYDASLGAGQGEVYSSEPQDGSHHIYEVWYPGIPGVHELYRDEYLLNSYSSPGLGSGFCRAEAGAEMKPRQIGLSNLEYSATFNHVQLSFLTNAGWYYWNGMNWWIDSPCGQGYSNPNCFNGIFYSPWHWANNKF